MYECSHSPPYLEVYIECDTVIGIDRIGGYDPTEGYLEGRRCAPREDTTYKMYIIGLCPDCVANGEEHRSWEKNGAPQETQRDETNFGSAQKAGSIPNAACCEQDTRSGNDKAPNGEQDTRSGNDKAPNGEQLLVVGELVPGTAWKYLGSTGSYT